ncbi:unnamed protein product [Bursaphelenchus okinawaensis]|uniref:Uncharacterized protein n=1 Tax=Bursaphelenchus okinawaensis TaxID=465554 RepID=A0A811KC99_9BILA|nr:unnamed protein product [Bursaphelenchus okinawaensis]CAG9098527.1 unnamed protein product [Bursaphelenchus okinawaensis]
MPGLIQLINALNAYVRIAWAVIWFALWGVFLYEFYLIVDKFLGYPASVTISLGYKTRAFPMVTICNQNPLRYPIVQNNSTYAEVNEIVKTYKELAQNGYGNVSGNPYNVNDYPDRFTKQTILQQAQVLAMSQITDDQKAYAGYKLENFILAYYYNNAVVNSTFFKEFIDPTYGLCYQFNTNDTGTTLFTDRAGSYFGLRALVLVNTEVQRAKKPYGDCEDNVTLNYYTGLNYTLTYCFRSCIQQKNIEACGCANPVYYKPDNVSYCTVDDLDCVFAQKTSQTDGSNFSVVASCGCNPACSDTDFDVILSVGKSPASSYSPLANLNPSYSCSVNSTLFANEAACITWFKTNSAIINIWYDGLDYTLQSEGSSYSLSTASNDLGGQAGLWVGISLVSVIEGIVFLIFVSLYFCFGRRHTDVEITDGIRTTDSRYNIMKGFKEELDTQDLMDDEIAIRYRAFKMRDEIKRMERIQAGERLNALAVAKAKQQKQPTIMEKLLDSATETK